MPASRSTLEPARSPAGENTLTVATWNLCGVERWGCTGGQSAKAAAVRRLARAGAQVLFLQEACARVVAGVRQALGPSWSLSFRPYTWHDRSGRSRTVRCDGPDRGAAGLAILSARPLSEVDEVVSPQPAAGLRRGILCATVAAWDVRVCNAHLSLPDGDPAGPGREYRGGQLRALTAHVPARRTVFGGDFNLRPPGAGGRADRLWPGTAYRTHRECDQTSDTDRSARPTHESGTKLDYLFTGLRVTGCRVEDTGVSDHRALVMRVDGLSGTG